MAGFEGAGLSKEDGKAKGDAFSGELKAALTAGGYPEKADPARINKPMVLVILTILVLYVTMVYGPIAAWLVELFPTRIRYTSMSLPYHIGNGWFGGFLPTIAFALVAATGNIYYGLWYPIVIALMTFVIGTLFLRETKDVDITRVIRPSSRYAATTTPALGRRCCLCAPLPRRRPARHPREGGDPVTSLCVQPADPTVNNNVLGWCRHSAAQKPRLRGNDGQEQRRWVPAFAGMTIRATTPDSRMTAGAVSPSSPARTPLPARCSSAAERWLRAAEPPQRVRHHVRRAVALRPRIALLARRARRRRAVVQAARQRDALARDVDLQHLAP